ncbi:MAG: tetratricopeptide repeat protein, partial [Chloroflexota bacterium]
KPLTIMHVDEGWLQRIDTCYDSMVSFLGWSHHTEQWFERRTRLIVGLICYWAVRGHLLEAQKWLESARTHQALPHYPHLHIDVLNGIGVVLAHRGLLDQAYTYHQQAFSLCTTHPDQERLNYVTKRIGYILAVRGKHHEAMHMHERSLALARELDDTAGIADAYMNLGHLCHKLGNNEAAQHALEQSIQLAHEIGAKRILAWSWIGLGHIAQTQQCYDLAQQNYDHACQLFQELHDKRGIAWSMIYLSVSTSRQGQIEQALAVANQSVVLFQTTHDQRGLSWGYYYLSQVNLVSGNFDTTRDILCHTFRQVTLNDDSTVLLQRALQLTILLMVELKQFAEATRLVGLAHSLHSHHISNIQPGTSDIGPQLIRQIQTHLSKAQFTTLWHTGRQMRINDVIQTLRELSPKPVSTITTKRVLTRREIDVLEAVAEGLSNQQIASHLTISTGTVRTHLNTIYGKLDVQSRTAAVHSARKLGMLV